MSSSKAAIEMGEQKAPQMRSPGISSHWRKILQETATEVLRHQAEGTFPLAAEVMTLDAAHYTCPEQFKREKQRIFQRVPLVLGASCELPNVGDYKTMDIAGIPVLVVHGRDGKVRAFLNSCTHRGSTIAKGCGSASRFICPYHGWTFDAQGSLLGVASAEDFGEIDKATMGLKAFPTIERAGLVWAILDPESRSDPSALLGGIDGLLDGFGLESWNFVESRILNGPNWKLAFDAHLEFYHIPVLHRDSFGAGRSNRALYYFHGQHQRLITPRTRSDIPSAADLFSLDDVPTEGEAIEALLTGEWIVYPAVSINSFYPRGERGIFLSQVFPGATVGESITIQTFLSASPPDEAGLAEIRQLFDLLAHAVGEEDLPTSFEQQKVLSTGLLPEVKFGRNEGGLQHFHRWIDAVVEADDAELPGLLGASAVLDD